MPSGRPTEYKEEFVEKALAYLKQSNDEHYDWVKSQGDKTVSYEHRVNVKLPSLERLAEYLDVATSSLYVWEKEYPRFSESLGKIKEAQKNRLIEKGLSGDYNSTIAKLVLSSNHGMRDGLDHTTNNKDMSISMIGQILSEQANEK